MPHPSPSKKVVVRVFVSILVVSYTTCAPLPLPPSVLDPPQVDMGHLNENEIMCKIMFYLKMFVSFTG